MTSDWLAEHVASVCHSACLVPIAGNYAFSVGEMVRPALLPRHPPPHTWLKLYQSIKAFGPQTIYPQQLKFNIACWKALFSTPALVQHSLHLQMLLLDVYDPSVTFGSMCLRVVSVFGALPLGCTTWLHLAIWHDFEMCCIDHMLMSSRFLDEPSKLFSLG